SRHPSGRPARRTSCCGCGRTWTCRTPRGRSPGRTRWWCTATPSRGRRPRRSTSGRSRTRGCTGPATCARSSSCSGTSSTRTLCARGTRRSAATACGSRYTACTMPRCRATCGRSSRRTPRGRGSCTRGPRCPATSRRRRPPRSLGGSRASFRSWWRWTQSTTSTCRTRSRTRR
ncbi:hypothetical protein EV182_002622, partial [Spiromyces aspiralis]